ncbi:transglutaminase-like putative cysteine protease [Caldalkalibacillus uzonensis]|uniref:Transglutaminase-like putative cysteine protease n=1 Tax=Caldalkalibacillus uzonensis TaxID=353224 RepID=A0ABU0CVH1_9BACI|nr:transglutaminase domain-containing protein [Caldalkalibacillus uzonensis]MDQ0340421.1 transglutaminase-like putative cysteine protease [Caldalkalibacillus uzonensis]
MLLLYNDQRQGSASPLLTSVMLALLTLLFWEWLRPLPLLTETHAVYPFVIFFVIVMVLKVLRLAWYFSVPLVSLVWLFLLHHLYFTGPLFSLSWLSYLVQELVYAIPFILERDWSSVSFLSRTFFFFMLIWLIALSLYESVFLRQRVLYFVVMTITYLAVLDTFTPFDAKGPVIRTVLGGFLLLSVVHWRHIASKAEQQGGTGAAFRPASWMVLSLVFIVAAASVAYTAPKAEPAWPDPVAFIQAYSEGSGARAVQRVGYDGADEVLGGPFIEDDTIVFQAVTETLHYWRGESRDYYNGQGWENSDSMEIFFAFDDVEQVRTNMDLFLADPATETDMIRAELYFAGERAQLFYPGDPLEVKVFTNTDVVAGWERFSGRWFSYDRLHHYQPAPLSGYELVSAFPSYSVKALREANTEQIPAEIRNRYTQLPDTLPDRVGQLALEAVEGEETMYDQVRAIEAYFRLNGFEYETEDVPVPGPGEDYVDQFLFETQRGYCDNFSSAMVVMLRTLDIPARWVKGFTSGEVVDRHDRTYNTVVRNKNAHSWVEVYFPGVGWVPFEPTRTFQNPYQFERDDLDLTQEWDSATAQQEFLEEQRSEQYLEQESESAAAQVDNQNLTHGLQPVGWMIAIALGFMCIVSLVFVFTWRRVILSWIIWRYRQGTDQRWLMNTYAVLLRYLGRFIKPKHPSQTLREYVLSLESELEIQQLIPLIRRFEETRYGNHSLSASSMRQIYQLWLSVMKQLKSSPGKK